MSKNGDNRLVLQNIDKLYPVFYKERDEVRDILIECVKESLEAYDFTEGLKRTGKADEGNLVHCDIVLPELVECASYKKYGTRYYPLDIYVQTYYGKEFWIEIAIGASEYYNDRLCTRLTPYEKTIIATTYIEPFAIYINKVHTGKCECWNPAEE